MNGLAGSTDAALEGSAVQSVHEFAASRAAREERRRTNRQMNELLRIDKLEEAQRRMAELAKDKVRRAVKQTKKEFQHIGEAPAAVVVEAELSDLNAEVRLYRRAGMSNAAVSLQDAIRTTLDGRAKEQNAEDEKLLRQKRVGMEMRQAMRLRKMQASQAADALAMRRAQQSEFTALVDAQSDEMHELTATVTGMIALGAAWHPDSAQESKKAELSRPWHAQLKRNRFRPSPQLSELQVHIEKLRDGGAVTSKVAELQERQQALLKVETAEWHERLIAAALGEHNSSLLSQLVASHKVAQAKMSNHHEQKTRLAEKQAAAATRMLRGQFRLEKLQLVGKFKQRQKREAGAEPANLGRAQGTIENFVGMPAIFRRRQGMFGSVTAHDRSPGVSRHLTPIGRGAAEFDDGGVGNAARHLDADALLHVLWMDPDLDVLRSFLRQARTRQLFTRFIESHSKRDLVGLKLWDQVQACKLLQDAELRAKQAVQLHDAYCASEQVQMKAIGGAYALELLQQRAEEVLSELQSAWLPAFMQEYCEEIQCAVAAAPAEFATLARLSGSWLEMLATATENLRFAVIAADMHEPGAKLVHVNTAFERLTGYTRHDVLGRNCRFLQGPDTEQEAVQQLVESLRGAQPVQVELTNYRKDGSAFRNALSLRPVHDSNGRYRYCIGVLADAAELTDPARQELCRLHQMLPSIFESALQAPQFAEIAAASGITEGAVETPCEPVQPQVSSIGKGFAKALREKVDVGGGARDALDAKKLLWLQKLDRSFRALLRYEEHIISFANYLNAEHGDKERRELRLLMLMREHSKLPRDAQHEATMELCAKLEEISRIDLDALSAELQACAGAAIWFLSSHCLPGFLRSSQSDSAVQHVELAHDIDRSNASASHLLWEQYRVPDDAVSWLYSIVGAVDKMALSVCVSDMRLAGAPLVYVNPAFCRMTGYSKSEAQGRNCRFLQGPDTELASVSALVEAIRRGTECTLKLTNYRRSGETFVNLLSLLPIHDSNGVYRFVVSLHNDALDEQSAIELHSSLMQLLPQRIKVSQTAGLCGPYNTDREVARSYSSDSALSRELVEVRDGRPTARPAQDIRCAYRFQSGHVTMRQLINAGPATGRLTALLWLCPSVAPALQGGLAHAEIAPHLGNLKPGLERELRTNVSDLGAEALATACVQNIGRFVEQSGRQLLKVLEKKDAASVREQRLDVRDKRVKRSSMSALPGVSQSGTWLQMLSQATADLSFALCTSDMHEPGAKLVHVNAAFERLTGYTRHDVLGRNCRFLQGPDTEQEAVQQLVESLRGAQPVQVELTNYRKDGSAFRNALSLRPVHDSNGRYRYCIGVLADVAELTDAKLAELERVRRMLPWRVESSLQPLPLADARWAGGGAPSQGHLDSRALSLAKLLWLRDLDKSMRALLAHPQGLSAFQDYLDNNLDLSAQAGAHLCRLLALRELIRMPYDTEQQTRSLFEAAHIFADKHLGGDALSSESPLEALSDDLSRREAAYLSTLAADCLPSFLRSFYSDSAVARVRIGDGVAFADHTHLVWSQYEPRVDALGWLYSTISAVEGMQFSVCVSDMRLAGAPLVYANSAFCRMTGYSRQDILGRNCRFLQGPETELESVSALVDALRRGTDCAIKITNYRRSGETFQSILCLQPVHDSIGVYRFCVALQSETSTSRSLHELLHSFARLLPTELAVGDAPPCGPKHAQELDQPHAPLPSRSWGEQISEAIASRAPLAALRATDLRASVRFSREHTVALQSLGVYDLARPFTRLAWLADPQCVFRTITPFACVRRIFAAHLDEMNVPKLRALWAPLKEIIELPGVPVLDLDARARALYASNVGVVTRGKSLQLILKELNDKARILGTRIVEEGAFVPFVESSRCLALLEDLYHEGALSGGEGAGQAGTVITTAQGSWLEMLAMATENLRFAVIAADMHEPGAKLVHVNTAFERLTGYTRHDVLGRNCRFLQGPDTEQEAVQQLVESLRGAQPVQVELTNYRKDGSAFRNALSLRPVHDSNGRYRYCIGVLADAAELTPTGLDELRGLCRLLPRRYEDVHTLASSNIQWSQSDAVALMSAEARRSVARPLFLVDCDDSLSCLARDAAALETFGAYLAARKNLLDFWVQATEVEIMCDEGERNALARSLIKEFLDPNSAALATAADAATHVMDESAIAFELLTECMPGFLVSPQSSFAVDALLRLDERTAELVDHALHTARPLIWSCYHVGQLGWLLAFAAVADVLPVSIQISDICTAGNPLLFVNKQFSAVTGYAPREALGRNCRFLQGPGTSMAAVTALKEELRGMGDAFCRLMNHRKSGEAFDTLLATRCVRDESGAVRFCVGLSVPISERIQLEDELQLMTKIFVSLPRVLGQQLDSSGADTLHMTLERLKTAIATVHPELPRAGMKPLIAIDPPVGALRSTTDLVRFYWSSLEAKQVLALLLLAPTRERLLAYVNARSPVAEQAIRTFLEGHAGEQTKELLASHYVVGRRPTPDAGKIPDFVRAKEIPASLESDLMRVQAEFVVPFVQTDARLGELVALTKGSAALDLPVHAGWLQMLKIATEKQGFALVAADMHEPGAKLVHVNAAFERLTGYTRHDVLGRNCRFLQGPDTEQEAVQQLVESLRGAQPVQVELTNYRKDGSAFRNALSLRPVHDSNGRYRYCIGVLADAAELTDAKLAELERVRRMLPDSFEATLEPMHGVAAAPASPEPSSVSPVDRLERAKLELLVDIEASVNDILESAGALAIFREHLEAVQESMPHGLGALAFYQEAHAFHKFAAKEQRERVHTLFTKYGGKFSAEGKSSFIAARDALAAVNEAKEASLARLGECLPGFTASDLSDAHAATLDLGSEKTFEKSAHLLWEQYRVPDDAVSWLYSIVGAVDKMALSVCVSDMRLAGAPLVYVNPAFCRMTGYSKSEAQGRNCRFLQGPDTELASVSALVDAIRRGTECTLKLTNYRRSGETFVNLLSLLPIHDSNGVYRFAIVVQADSSALIKLHFELYAALLQLLPASLDVGDAPPCGPIHSRGDAAASISRHSSVSRLIPQASRDHQSAVDAADLSGFANATTRRRLNWRKSKSGFATPADADSFASQRERLDAALLGTLPVERAADVRDAVRFSRHFEAARDTELTKVALETVQHAPRPDLALLTAAVEEDTQSEAQYSSTSSAPTDDTSSVDSVRAHSVVSSKLEKRNRRPVTATSAAQEGAVEGDAAIVYTKLMWLRQRTPEFVRLLLTHSFTENAWTRSLVARRQPTSRLAFCCRVAQLDRIEGTGPRRAALIQLAELYLGLREQRRVEEIEQALQAKERELFGELALREFGAFVASRQCTELVQRLRERLERLTSVPEEDVEYEIKVLAEMHLLPPAPPTGASTSAAAVVHTIDAALREYPAAVLLCDRTLGGLPIVSVSIGIERLTGYEASEVLGWNCRLLQGPETDIDVVKALKRAIREAKAVEVSLTNYRKDGTPFTNQLSLSRPLRVRPRGEADDATVAPELIAAVLRTPPPPLQAARFDAETAELLNVLISCNTPCTSNDETLAAAAVLWEKKALADGRRWALDAEGTLNRMLRVPSVRQLFMRSSLQLLAGSDGGAKSMAPTPAPADAAPSADQQFLLQEVQLLMHSENVLCEQAGYLRIACVLWAELGDLAKVGGWEYRVALQDIARKHIMPERGGRKYCALWRALRSSVYDPLAAAERQLLVSSAVELPTIEDLRETLRLQEQRTKLTFGSKSANEAIRILRRTKIGFDIDASLDEDTCSDAGEGAPSVLADDEEEVELPPNELDDLPPNELLESGAAGAASDEDETSTKKGAKTRTSGSEASATSTVMSTDADCLKDVGMLMHVLARVLSIHVLPAFLSSPGFCEVVREVRSASDRNPLHALLEVELQSLKTSQPATSEAWAGGFMGAAQFLPHAIVLSDLSLPGAPIVSVNSAFEVLTGFDAVECVGRNCRFLQGDRSETRAISAISHAVRTHSPCHVSLHNYKRDGTVFLNLLSLKPVFDSDGLGRYMVGCLVEVHEQYAATKAQLRHVDRLLKLTESRLAVPSGTDARQRMLAIRSTVLREPPPYRRSVIWASATDDDAERTHDHTSLTNERARSVNTSVEQGTRLVTGVASDAPKTAARAATAPTVPTASTAAGGAASTRAASSALTDQVVGSLAEKLVAQTRPAASAGAKLRAAARPRTAHGARERSAGVPRKVSSNLNESPTRAPSRSVGEKGSEGSASACVHVPTPPDTPRAAPASARPTTGAPTAARLAISGHGDANASGRAARLERALPTPQLAASEALSGAAEAAAQQRSQSDAASGIASGWAFAEQPADTSMVRPFLLTAKHLGPSLD